MQESAPLTEILHAQGLDEYTSHDVTSHLSRTFQSTSVQAVRCDFTESQHGMRACVLKNQSSAPQVLCSYTSFTTSKLQVRFVPTPSHHRLHPPAPSYQQTRAFSADFGRRSSKFRKPLHVQKVAKMSWMDSWSRPSKSQATPAPYYLLPGGELTPYCKTCGRVIGKSCALPLCRKLFQPRLTSMRCSKNGCKQERYTCKILLKPMQEPQARCTRSPYRRCLCRVTSGRGIPLRR
jgi:hypothetical protein